MNCAGRAAIFAVAVLTAMVVWGWIHQTPMNARSLIVGGVTICALLLLGAINTLIRNRNNIQQEAMATEQERLATHDGLTGIPNRRLFDAVAETESRKAAVLHESVSVIIADLDHFKQVNDEHGHPLGDEVLKAAAQRLRSVLREHDIVARWGGEEFIVLLPGTDAETASTVAELMRERLSKQDLVFGIRVTGSFGVATVRPVGEMDMKGLIHQADDALYKAKRGGRDRVEAAE